MNRCFFYLRKMFQILLQSLVVWLYPVYYLFTYFISTMDRVLLALQQIISAEVATQAWSWNGPLKHIKKVYYGDPIQIPEANLPAIAIQPMLTPYVQRWSQYDDKSCSIEIRLVVNRKEYYNDTGSPDDTVLVVKAMVEAFEKTNAWKDTSHASIAWIIQSNPCLQYTDPQDNILKNACSISRMDQVIYRFSQDRWFPTYEGVGSVICRVIGDR